MLLFEYALLACTILCLFLGVLGIFWGRGSSCPHRASWGKMLFIATLLLLGGAMQFAAFYEAEGIVPLGLLAGFLVVVMLWETPASKVATHNI